MSGNGYLFAAYSVTWMIHIAYLGTIVSRYSRLRREIESLKKEDLKKK
jgi:CcmD family protein